MSSGRLPVLVVLAVALAGAACSDLDRFVTRQDEVWKGQVVSSSYVRHGFEAATTLEAAPMDLSNYTTGPGRISTSDLTFTEAALTPIKPASYDSFLELELGGARSFPYLVPISNGPHAGELALGILSLMEDDTLELRIVRGTSQDSESDDLYGIFPLTRQSRDE